MNSRSICRLALLTVATNRSENRRAAAAPIFTPIRGGGHVFVYVSLFNLEVVRSKNVK